MPTDNLPAPQTFIITVGGTGYLDTDIIRTALEKECVNDVDITVELATDHAGLDTLPWRVRIGDQTIAAVHQVSDAAVIISNPDVVDPADLRRATISHVGVRQAP